MAYVKKYIGERETGKMLPCIIDGVDLGSYPEREKIYETVWETNWQPEHMPVGSVVRYFFSHRKEEGIQEVVVTGHHQNGVKSWVIQTDKPSTILTDGDHKESFNASYVTEVVSRGNGTTRFINGGWMDAYWAKMEYLAQLSAVPTNVKRPHEYAASHPITIIAYVLSQHPTFKDMGFDGHNYAILDTLTKALRPIFKITRLNGWSGYATVNKKRLVRDLKSLLARSRVPVKTLERHEKKIQAEEYRRDMESFLEDL